VLTDPKALYDDGFDNSVLADTHALPTPLSASRHLLEPPVSINQYSGTSRHLVEVWPSECDLSHIYNLPASLSTHLHMRSSTFSAGSSLQDLPTVREMLQLPLPGSHPTLIAHKLLALASLLQGALAMIDLPVERQQRFEQLMLNITVAVTKLVTMNDELTSSIEGIECIMMEATIQNHAGKLHQAWRTVRRAATVGQVLGLHRNIPLPAESFLDPKKQSQFNLEQFCFHIVCMDRYLSITLGLPHAYLMPYATTPEQLTVFKPIDRMARLQCIIVERLLDRPKKDLAEVCDIDQLLLEAAAQMPPHWWLLPDSHCSQADAPDHDRTIARFNYQLSHYHLLLRLYLPYVFQPGHDTDHGHGKRVALNASREILSRYLAFRTWNKSRYYCRGMDFIALIAMTVLCVIHIDWRAQRATSTSLTRAPNELAHNYLVDQGMMQRTLEVLQGFEYDETASKLTKMMQSLLDVEADAAIGKDYSATAVYNGDKTAEYQSELLDEGRKLQLRIPYFGTITLHRSPASVMINDFAATNELLVTNQGICQTSLDWDDGLSLQEVVTCNDWTLQNVNQSLFQDLFGNTSNY
jgi:hypothetical protein